mgnify:FL=1|jgi:hypothetical protein
MVNNYNLEWELLKKSQVTNRSPKSIMGDDQIVPNHYQIAEHKEENKDS